MSLKVHEGEVKGSRNASISYPRLAPVVSAFFFLFFFFFFFFFFFCHSLSLPVAIFVSLIPFYCLTTELSFLPRDITYQIIISCTRLYTFENKTENDRKDRVWRQTNVTLTPATQLALAL